MQPLTYARARWLFLRALGVIYLIAFGSLYRQIPGLIGREGILPAFAFLDRAKLSLHGLECWLELPTVFWWNATDAALLGACLAGIFFSILIILDIFPKLALFFTWALYLSFFSVSGDFLHFQWDTLLLETGFLAIFFAPFYGRNRSCLSEEPSRVFIWLLRFVLFRLMFQSGIAKWNGGDPVWRDMTALLYYYETQPLPPWTAWMAHQLPAFFHKVSAVAMYAIEIGAPFLMLGPRMARRAGFVLIAGFQALILLTGNYTFFNLLAITLAILLLDDEVLPRFICVVPKKARRLKEWPPAALAALIFYLFLAQCSMGWHPLRNFCTLNSYGLFVRMTITRPEIIIEGSSDGEHWLPYEFKYKPGDLSRKPGFVAPHQPRLDWQMWFAALGHYKQNLWFLSFCQRLLEGSPEVLKLLKKNPFPEPPRYIRAIIYNYKFTTPAERKATGNWWKREMPGLYIPPISLKEKKES